MFGVVATYLLLGCLARGENEIPIKNLEKCLSEGGFTGVVNCAAVRVIRSMEKADNEQVLEILPGVALISNSSSRAAKSLVKEDLPSDPTKKSAKLLDMLLATTSHFLSSRSLTIKLPSTSPDNLARSLEEGRGRMKKIMGSMILGIGGKMMSMVPIMFGGLALLTTKALLVGKLAFVLSLILFIQMFFSGRNIIPFYSYGTSYGVPAPPTTYGTNFGTNTIGGGGGWGVSSQYPYARSINVGDEKGTVEESAQDYAYAAQKP